MKKSYHSVLMILSKFKLVGFGFKFPCIQKPNIPYHSVIKKSMVYVGTENFGSFLVVAILLSPYNLSITSIVSSYPKFTYLGKGSFNKYVDMILSFFDYLVPTYLMDLSLYTSTWTLVPWRAWTRTKIGIFWPPTYLPTSSCPFSFWMTPKYQNLWYSIVWSCNAAISISRIAFTKIVELWQQILKLFFLEKFT